MGVDGIETYYLIDYENVGADGLSGCDKLTKTDHIYIFFTKNAKKIDMTEIANHGDSELDMIEVPAGKQSTDIHISSYLGFIAGTKATENKAKNCSVVIISKDTDYDNVINFWVKKTGIKASKALKIKEATPITVQKKQNPVMKNDFVKADGGKKTKLNQDVMKALSAKDFEASVCNTVAQLVTRLYGEEHFMNEVHNMLREKYENYLEVYKAIKPVLNQYANDIVNIPSTKYTTNTEIQILLGKANFENDIINYVTSVVTKNIGVKNGKQQIYRTIISEYGQNKGLNIYNHIKKHI